MLFLVGKCFALWNDGALAEIVHALCVWFWFIQKEVGCSIYQIMYIPLVVGGFKHILRLFGREAFLRQPPSVWTFWLEVVPID